MPRPAAPPAALLALLALAPTVARAEDGLDLWLEAGGGADSNPTRVRGAAGAPRGFATLLGRARLRVDGEAGQAAATLTEAGRWYPSAGGADGLATRLEAAGRLVLPGGVAASATGAASDARQRDGQLDRHALRGEAALSVERGGLLGALAGGWSLFAPREPSLRPFRSGGPEAWLRGGWSAAPHHRLTAALGASLTRFPGWAALGPPASPTRTDQALRAAAEWSWRGEALASAGLEGALNRSDAAGGDFRRLRLTASTALRLPLAVTLATRLALQWTRYPDPLLLSAQQRLAEGQESLDTAEARLTRSLAGPLEASLALAWFRAEGSPDLPGYRRVVVTLSLGWRPGASP